MLRALADEFGTEQVGLVPIWLSDGEDGLPCVVLRHVLEVPEEGARIGRLNKIAFIASAVLAAFRWRKDLVIICGHPWLAPVGAACAFVARAPFAQWAHGAEAWIKLSPWIRWSMHRASVSFAVSNYTARRMEEAADLPTGSAITIPLPLEESEGALATSDTPVDRSPVDGPYVLAVARLDAGERRKGIDTTIAALSKVSEAVPGIRYVVVGEGQDRPRLVELAEQHGVAEQVLFLGTVSEEDLQALYQGALAFVMPSGQEGFGLVYLEAGRYGVPSIAAFFGGAPEAVIDGETGFVVPFDEPNVLAEKVIELITDEPLRVAMGQAASARARKLHSFARFREAITHIVDLLFEERRD